MKRILLVPAAIAALAVLASVRPARAGSATANLTVTATVLGSCNISPATLAFGNYDPAAITDNDAQATITVNCTYNSNYWIGLGNGSSFSGGRRMAGGTGEFLNYDLYKDSGRTTLWNNTDPGAASHSIASTAGAGLKPYTATVYGRIPKAQTNISTGAFSDSVVMTVNF